MHPRFGNLAALCLLAIITSGNPPILPAAEPPITAQDLPRVPAVEPGDTLRTFRLKTGFQLQLVASEPNVISPVAMCFDERGRLFVVEMVDYSERREQIPHLGRIRLLEDTNGDGVFDKSTMFADNLPWPTGLFCYNGGLFVIATPDILYLKDTKGTGKADSREVVFTGFAAGVDRINVQELANSLIWGLDNRIHGATSGSGGLIRSLKHPGRALDLRNRDFAIEPRTMTITAEAGGGQHGLSFDDYGRRFTCNNSDHIRLFMYDEKYVSRNPFYDLPPALESIAEDGAAAEVYRISLEEPWRVVRTRWRIAGVMSGPVEGGGRSSGYFTGATGITIYRGNAFSKEFHGDAFIGECAFNLVHRKKLFPNDVGLKARRPADEQNVEFLASTDNWFRPVQFANAPDGTLYLIDMYREVVEHPWSLPDSIKKFLDLNSGSDRGRIYRIVPDGFTQPKLRRLDQATSAELVALLESPNGWDRDTASRLLYERRDKTTVPPLVTLLRNSKSPLGRLHALYALSGLDALQETHVMRALDDPDAHVREHAIKLSEKFISNDVASDHLWARLKGLARDPDVQVRYQLAFTIGEMKNPGRIEALDQIIRRDVSSRWFQAAVLNSVSEDAVDLFVQLAADSTFSGASMGREFLCELARIIGARNESAATSQAVASIDRLQSPEKTLALMRALGEGLQRGGSSLKAALSNKRVQELFARASRISADGTASESTRLEAIRLLGLADSDSSRSSLLKLLDANQTRAIQLAALSTLSHSAAPRIASDLAQRWLGFDPAVRSAALSALLSRPDRALVLLESIQKGTINSTDLTTSQIQFLKKHRDPQVSSLATKVFVSTASDSRQKVFESFRDALRLPGNPARGKEIYLQRCSSCHRLGGQGFALGPDLVTVKSAGKEKMLGNILDPNREVAPQYIAFEVETKDGESLVGIIANETTATMTVLQAFGRKDVIQRPTLKSMRSLGQSLMPEGLEQGLTSQDFANLLEYISTAEAK
jgi:putative membrane-bound dehydrogenase-like protein